jgi:hypothetical protein
MQMQQRAAGRPADNRTLLTTLVLPTTTATATFLHDEQPALQGPPFLFLRLYVYVLFLFSSNIYNIMHELDFRWSIDITLFNQFSFLVAGELKSCSHMSSLKRTMFSHANALRTKLLNKFAQIKFVSFIYIYSL